MKRRIILIIKQPKFIKRTYSRKNLQMLPLIGGFLIALFSSSCQKTMEDYPLEIRDIDLVFDPLDSLGVNAVKFHNNIYTNLPNGFNRISTSNPGSGLVGASGVSSNILDAGTDDALPNTVGDNVEFLSSGAYNVFNLPDDVWYKNYQGIRKVNVFLANIDVVPFLDNTLKPRLIAESKALRAIFYFELIKRWGGVPLIGDQVLAYDQNIEFPRNTFQECIDYILNELDEAYADLLKPDASSGVFGQFYGRMNRGVAMGLKSRLLLYAASPVHNTENNLEKWNLAAQASKNFIDSVTAGVFSYNLSTSTSTAHVTAANIGSLSSSTSFPTNVNRFLNVFSVRANNEIILPYLTSTNSTLESLNGPVGNQRGDAGKTNPTQNLVDEFEMQTGQMISDANSGYNEQQPYYNRDPRMVASIFVNGMPWTGRTVQVYDGGIDRPIGFGGTNTGETRTGYYMRKFLSDNGSQTARANHNHNFPYMRYAEILLNYAEAQNEYSGPDQSVYDAINRVRSRVRMPNIRSGLNQTQMRERIRHERRVELAFEEHRFYDIRRWDIAKEVLNNSLRGIQIQLPENGQLNYRIVDVFQPSFTAPMMNLHPIPIDEMNSNTNMVQNPGWH